MDSKIKKIFKLDWLLFFSVFSLIGFGLVAIYSLSQGGGVASFSFYDKQLFFVFVATVVFFFAYFVWYDFWRDYAEIIYFVSLVLLLVVLVFGKTTHGAISWLNFGFFKLQPVELVKVSLILVLSKYLSFLKADIITWRQLLKSFVYYVLPPFILVVLQPDMGSAIILLLIWAGMIFLAGIGFKKVVILCLSGVLALVFAWMFVLKGYQKERIFTFINPQKDALGSGYNVIQATIAVGSGGLKGKGIGHGSQSQLRFIPEQHTDFIFATIAEESGLLGVSLIILLFGIIFIRLRIIALHADKKFGMYAVNGLLVVLVFQVIINMGMNIGIVPVTGLSLPFLSYGGSFLVILMFLMGLAQNVWNKRRKGNDNNLFSSLGFV